LSIERKTGIMEMSSFLEMAGTSGYDARNIAGFPVKQLSNPRISIPQQWLADSCLGFLLPGYL